jgi:hypothetical protein
VSPPPDHHRRARELLGLLDLPTSDPASWEASGSRFADGSPAGIEVPGIEAAADLVALLEACEAAGAPPPCRVVETRGMSSLPAREVREMVRICADHGIGLVGSIGPRASKDVGRFARAPHGQRAACRLRGVEGVVRGLEDALRSLDLGVRGLLIYDEGLLEILTGLRARGEVPASLRIKASIALGTSNPVHAAQLEARGADSLNPVNDLPLPALAGLRQSLSIPLDVHLDDGPAGGGIDRLPELPDLVSACAPVFLKCTRGGRSTDASGQAQRLARIGEEMERHELLLLAPGGPEAGVPEPG